MQLSMLARECSASRFEQRRRARAMITHPGHELAVCEGFDELHVARASSAAWAVSRTLGFGYG